MMRIIVIDSENSFTNLISQRCKKASVFCQAFNAPATALSEIKKNPDAIDIIILSKELAGADGLALAQTLRKDPKTTDIPYILVSSTWGKPEFAKHQKTEFGANAYYNKKSPIAELESTIEAVTGFKFAAAAEKPAAPPNLSSTGLTGLNIQLQAASEVVNIAEDLPSEIAMAEPISLFDEMPVPAAAAPAPAPAAPVAAAPASAPATAPAPAPTQASAPAEPTAGGGIELNLTSTSLAPPAIENKPVAPASAMQSTSSSTGSGGIEINLGGAELQVETSSSAAAQKSAPAAPQAADAPGSPPVKAVDPEKGLTMSEMIVMPASEPPAGAPAMDLSISVPPAAEPAVPQSEGSLFAIDLNAGNEDASAAVAAAAPAAAASAPTPTPASAASAPSLDISLSEGAVSAEPAATVVPEAVIAVPEAVLAPGLDDAAAASLGLSVAPAAEQVPPAPPEMPAAVAAPEPVAQISEEEAAKDLPYLFAGPSAALAAGVGSSGGSGPSQARAAIEATGSSGGNEDLETLKKYLTMREQDVSVLTAQLTYAKEELEKSDNAIKRLTMENEDLGHQINDLKKKSETLEQELQHAGKSREGELEQLRFEVKSKIDRIKFLEERLNDSAQQYEKLKERVRVDIRKIRIREKELENKLEILKKDSETLIAARENKILELKRKIDLLEFNYDTLQDKNENERQNVVKANEKIERVLKVLKLALGVIEAEGEQQGEEGKGLGAGDVGAKVA